MLWWRLRQLRSKENAVRLRAIVKLGDTKDARAVEPLLAVLNDPNYPKIEVIEALARIGDSRAAEALVTTLRDRSSSLNEAAAKALLSIQHPRCVEALVEVLQEQNAWLRSREHNSTLEKQSAGDIETNEWRLCQNLIRLLGDIGDQRAIGPLLALSEPSLQQEILASLTKVDPDWASSEAARGSLDRLILALGDEDAQISKAAEERLKILDPDLSKLAAINPNVVNLVELFVREPNYGIRGATPWHTLDPLKKIDPNWMARPEARKVVPRLLNGLRSAEALTRQRATQMLGIIRDPRAVAPLIDTLLDDQPEVRDAARDSLIKLKRMAMPEVLKMLGAENPHLRCDAVDIVGLVGEAEVTQHVLPLLADEDSEVRAAALNATNHMAKSRRMAPSILVAALHATDSRLRAGAATALGIIRDPESIKQLPDLLCDDDAAVRAAAAIALGRNHHTPAASQLLGLFADKDAVVRAAAAEAFGYLTDRRAVEPLLKALEDDQPLIRKLAAAGLKKQKWQPSGTYQAMLRHLALENWWQAYELCETTRDGDLISIAVRALVRALQDDIGEQFEAAAWALGTLRCNGMLNQGSLYESAFDGLLQALERPSGDIRRGKAAWALRHFKDPRAIDSLAKLIHEEEEAVAALACAGDPRGLETLIEMLTRGSAWAAEALGEVANPRTVKPLLTAARSNKNIAQAATDALERVLAAVAISVTVEDLCLVCNLEDVRAIGRVEMDLDYKPYETTLNCSRLRDAAREELQRRELLTGVD